MDNYKVVHAVSQSSTAWLIFCFLILDTLDSTNRLNDFLFDKHIIIFGSADNIFYPDELITNCSLRA